MRPSVNAAVGASAEPGNRWRKTRNAVTARAVLPKSRAPSARASSSFDDAVWQTRPKLACSAARRASCRRPAASSSRQAASRAGLAGAGASVGLAGGAGGSTDRAAVFVAAGGATPQERSRRPPAETGVGRSRQGLETMTCPSPIAEAQRLVAGLVGQLETGTRDQDGERSGLEAPVLLAGAGRDDVHVHRAFFDQHARAFRLGGEHAQAALLVQHKRASLGEAGAGLPLGFRGR